MTGLFNFTNQELVLDRLKREWHEHGKLIIAVDFDGVLHDFHKEGLQLMQTVRAVGDTHQLGNEVFCFTANSDHECVKQHCLKMLNFIPNINVSPLDHIFTGRKPFYSLLLDDRAGLNCALRTLNQLNNYIRENK